MGCNKKSWESLFFKVYFWIQFATRGCILTPSCRNLHTGTRGQVALSAFAQAIACKWAQERWSQIDELHISVDIFEWQAEQMKDSLRVHFFKIIDAGCNFEHTMLHIMKNNKISLKISIF